MARQDPIVLTPSQATTLALIEHAAECGDVCPTNSIIADALGALSFSIGARMVNQLEDLGLISVMRGNRLRVISIISTGKRTAGTIERPHWRYRDENKHRRHVKYGGTQNARRSNAVIVAEKLAMPRVDRDPCLRCGVRGDIGCEHSR